MSRGYVDPKRRLSWIDYERLYRAWWGEFGGIACNAIAESGRFVDSGLERSPESSLAAMKHGWMLSSGSFVGRLKGGLPVAPTPRGTPQARALLRKRPETTADHVLWSDTEVPV